MRTRFERVRNERSGVRNTRKSFRSLGKKESDAEKVFAEDIKNLSHVGRRKRITDEKMLEGGRKTGM